MDATDYAFLASFFLVSLLGTASPGPATIYVARQGFAGGLSLGLSSLAGILTGDVIYVLIVVSGLSAMMLASQALLDVVGFGGAAYLVWIGGRMIRSALAKAPAGVEAAVAGTGGSPFSAFRGALTLHATNPKALVYFGAVFVQFVNPASAAPAWQPLGTLALIHVPTAAGVLLAYALLGSALRRSRPDGSAARWLDGAIAGFLLVSALAISAWRLGT